MPIVITSPAGIPSWSLTGFTFDSAYALAPDLGGTPRPTGIIWNNDGTKAYVINDDTNAVHQYTLSTPYDFSSGSATYDSVSGDVSSEHAIVNDGAWSTDGTKFFMVSDGSNDVYEYASETGSPAVATPFNIGNISYTGSSVDVNTLQGGDIVAPRGVTFNNTGSKMFIANYNAGVRGVYEFDLSPNFLLSSASYSQFILAEPGDSLTGVTFQDGGKAMAVSSEGGDLIRTYTLTVGYDVSTATVDATSLSVTTEETIPTGLALNPAGTQLYVAGFAGSDIVKYTK